MALTGCQALCWGLYKYGLVYTLQALPCWALWIIVMVADIYVVLIVSQALFVQEVPQLILLMAPRIWYNHLSFIDK